MNHVAILSKKRKLLTRIISGEKTIESRWYRFRRAPYKSINKGDHIFFKESGDKVMVKARVAKALFFDGLDKNKVIRILEKYGKRICIPVSYAPALSGKNFCTLVFIEDVKKVSPFNIDKKGFGLMAAWISVSDIRLIRR